MKKTCKLAVLLLTMSMLGSVFAAQHEIVLKEHLNRQWNHEVVNYPVSFDRGTCIEGSGTLLQEGVPLPFQLSPTDLWPDGKGIQKGILSFVVEDLAPRTSRTYVFSYSGKAGSGTSPASALTVKQEGDLLHVANGKSGIVVPIGTTSFDTPVASGTVPAPIAHLVTADGKVIGGSALYGETQLTKWSSSIVRQGPILVEVQCKYTYVGGRTLTVTLLINAADPGVEIHTHASADMLEDGWRLALNKGLPLGKALLIPGMGFYAKELEREITPSKDNPLCSLSCWQGDGWFKERPGSVRLLFKDRQDEMQVVMKDSGSWVTWKKRPSWGDFRIWTYDMILTMWHGWERKLIPFEVDTGRDVALKINNAEGYRKFAVGIVPQSDKLLQRYRGTFMSVNSPLPRLDEVKDMVLEWNDPRRRHPYLLMSERDLTKAGLTNQAAYDNVTDVEYLLTTLDSLGDIDLMRRPKEIACLYDANIDSDRLTKEERAIARAQFAYLGYLLQSPTHWSLERGMNSGNPNMVVSRILSLSLFGLCMQGNPQGKVWADYGSDWMQYWLDTVADDQGYWTESSHYARVSWSYFILYAIAARNAGYHDFLTHPRFKAMCDYYTRTKTPPDPLRHAQSLRLSAQHSPAASVDPPYGRGVRGDAYDYAALVAKATLASDPEFSAHMQWSWQRSGFAEFMSSKTKGLTGLYIDRHLPTKCPDWGSEHIDRLGYLFRSHVGDPRENYLLFVSQYYTIADGEIWPSNTGAIVKWFAGGVPIGGAFARMYKQSHVLLENRVMLACNWDPETMEPISSGYVTQTTHNQFASLGELDYTDVDLVVPEIVDHLIKIDPKAPAFPVRKTEGETPLDWKRQVMLVKGPSPADINYLVLRDSVRSAAPTQWHFWTLSEKLVARDQTFDRDELLKDTPGHTVVPASELTGQRFTALGQFGVDLEYYVASPTDSPRYTARYGHRQGAYGIHPYQEYQDLMHLQLEGPGTYFVCLFPNQAGTTPPEFATFGEGCIIRIKGTFGTDYCFISDKPVKAEGDGSAFTGTSASVQDRDNALRLSLADGGSVGYRGYHLQAPFAVSMAITPTSITLEASDPASTGDIILSVPGTSSLSNAADGKAVAAKRRFSGRRFIVPKQPGVKTLRLLRN